ncbi:MAG: hypothetical protein HOV80_20075 [Polyangiaceae bacterium]|nr:hypothetical protein [Polyangiaceae bacterium]
MLGNRPKCLIALGIVSTLTIVACGDDDGGSGGSGAGTTTTTTTGPTTTSTTQTTTTTSQSSSQSSTSTSTGGEGGGNCDAVIEAVNAALADAKVCNPLIDIEQCTQVLDGPCCPVAVNPGNAAAVQAFQDAMTDLENGHCNVMCPEIPCIENPVGACQGDTEMGSCSEQPPQ